MEVSMKRITFVMLNYAILIAVCVASLGHQKALGNVTVNGQPDWVEQGPGPMRTPFGWQEQVGAVQAIAADPANSNRVFVASVNGGIWRTENAYAASPTWIPLSDHMASLSVSAIAFSPFDINRNTLFAGFGNFSSGGLGGPSAGLIKSADGGNSWFRIGGSTFDGFRIRRIVPTRIQEIGQVILVATIDGGGLFRSADGGATFSRVANGPRGASDVRTDAGGLTRFYAGVPPAGGSLVSAGILHSIDAGRTWVTANGDLPVAVLQSSARILIDTSSAVDPVTGNRPVYALLADDSATTGVYRSADSGAHWTSLAPLPGFGGQASLHLSILAGTDPRVLFVGARNGVYRWDGTDWTLIAGAAADGTATHQDSRDLVYDAAGGILESDDGGIYRLVNPNNLPGRGTRRWGPVVGNIRVSELYSTGYDSLNNIVLASAQDNGVPEQSIPDGYVYSKNWYPPYDGDGAACDSISLPGRSIHYVSPAYLTTDFRREIFDNQHNFVVEEFVALRVAGTSPVKAIYFLDPGSAMFNTPFILNAVAPARMLICANGFLYESFNRGDDVTQLGPGAPMDPQNAVGNVNWCNFGNAGAWAYGGTFFGNGNPDVLYTGFQATLRVRTSGHGLPVVVPRYPGGCIRGIALDPNDWRRAYVLDDSGRVWRTTDAGATAGGWVEVTGNLHNLSTDLRLIRAVSPTVVPGHEALVVAGRGGVFFTPDPRIPSQTTWAKLGGNFPNVVVTSLLYDSTDDILLAGTWGRGAWKLKDAIGLLVGCRSGTLDPTLNFTGKRTIDYGGGAVDAGRGVAVQPDGKIIVVGKAGRNTTNPNEDFGIMRFNADGVLDTSFGTGGFVRTDFGFSDDEGATGVALQPDGKIVVVGTDQRNLIDIRSPSFAVARYNANGTLDTSFNGTGKRVIPFDTPGQNVSSEANAVVIRPNGKILVVGVVDGSSTFATRNDFALAQLNSNGSLDTSFGPDHTGRVETDFSRTEDVAKAVALQSDGRAVVVGCATTFGTYNFAVSRYNVDGSVESVGTYDFNGGDDFATGVAIQPDGKVLLGGHARSSRGDRDFAVLRLNADLNPDNSFGAAGKALADFGTSTDAAEALVLQSDGKIVLVGSTVCCNFGPTDFGLVRFNPNGSLDTPFGPYGDAVALTGFSGFNPDSAFAVTLDGDGRLVTAGTAFVPGDDDYALTRWCPGEYPYGGTVRPVPGTIQAEDYDNGGPNVAYADTTVNLNEAAGSFGSNYRPGSGVDLETDSDGGNNVHVAYIRAGEWLHYTVDVTAPGPYRVLARISSGGNGGTFHIEFDGVDKTGSIPIPSTGGYLNFQTLDRPVFTLSAGRHIMRVAFDSNGANGVFVGNLNYLQFCLATQPQLSIARSGPNVVLSWPSSAPGFHLQSAANLNPPIIWTDAAQAPTLTGGRYTVTVQANMAAQFYRLVCP